MSSCATHLSPRSTDDRLTHHVCVENTGSPYMRLVLPVDQCTGLTAVSTSRRRGRYEACLLPFPCNERRCHEADEQARDAEPDKPAAACSREDEDSKAKDAAEDAHATKEEAAQSHGAQSPCYPLAPRKYGGRRVTRWPWSECARSCTVRPGFRDTGAGCVGTSHGLLHLERAPPGDSPASRAAASSVARPTAA